MLYDNWRNSGTTLVERLPACEVTTARSRLPGVPPILLATEVGPKTVSVLYMTDIEAKRLLSQLQATLKRSA